MLLHGKPACFPGKLRIGVHDLRRPLSDDEKAHDDGLLRATVRHEGLPDPVLRQTGGPRGPPRACGGDARPFSARSYGLRLGRHAAREWMREGRRECGRQFGRRAAPPSRPETLRDRTASRREAGRPECRDRSRCHRSPGPPIRRRADWSACDAPRRSRGRRGGGRELRTASRLAPPVAWLRRASTHGASIRGFRQTPPVCRNGGEARHADRIRSAKVRSIRAVAPQM